MRPCSLELSLKEIVAENNEFEILQHRFAAMIQRLETENKTMEKQSS